jgi:alpha-mannosidase
MDPVATYEVPYGHLVRPVDGREEPAQQWVDVSGISMSDGLPLGLGLLNDGKYSFDVKENDLRMTVARSAMFAEHRGQRDEWNEFMDQGIQYFSYALVPHSGDWRNARMVQKALELNLSPEIVVETYHAGFLPPSLQGMVVSSPDVVATVFKRSEDGVGYVVRVYETTGRAVTSEFAVPILGRSWTASFRPLEIKTFLIPDDTAEDVEEIPIIERPPTPLVPEASGNGS